MGKTVLLLSNGHGEDEIGAVLARALQEEVPALEVRAFPLVGLGGPYREAGLPVVGRQQAMPTGGFIRQGVGFLWQDVRAGLISLTWWQIRELRRMRPEIDCVIIIGDVYPLWLAGRYLRKPAVFLSTAKSSYISGHFWFETRMMRRVAGLVFARDERTAEDLRRAGVRAEYCGNLMMDSLRPVREGFGTHPGRQLIGILPGSRREAYDNMVLILRTVVELDRRAPERFAFVTALAGSLSYAKLAGAVSEAGWGSESVSRQERDLGIAGKLVNLANPELEVLIARGRFADLLREAVLVIGMAGTGNEQAVGMGTPVVSFAGKGPQFTSRFLAAQHRLLGDSLAVTDGPEEAPGEILAILTDEERYRRMQAIGRERMGGPGGAKRMAARIAEFLETPYSG